MVLWSTVHKQPEQLLLLVLLLKALLCVPKAPREREREREQLHSEFPKTLGQSKVMNPEQAAVVFSPTAVVLWSWY